MSMKGKALVKRNVKLYDCVVNLGEYRFDSETKLVKYVFERDKDKLFLKYIKQTLIVGVLVIIVSVTVYFRDQYKDTWYEKWNISILAYMLSCFLLCTYRCFSNMLNLIFMNDVELFLDDDSFRKKTSSELEFEKECEKR